MIERIKQLYKEKNEERRKVATWRTHGAKKEDVRSEEDERGPMDRIVEGEERAGRAKRDGKRADG